MKKTLIISAVSLAIVAFAYKKLYPIYLAKVNRNANIQAANAIVDEINKIKVIYDNTSKRYIGKQENIDKMIKLRADLTALGFDYSFETNSLIEKVK